MKNSTRRRFLKTSAAAAGFGVLNTVAQWSEAVPEDPDRPNILLLVTDDQRWDALGCMGNPIIQTPHLNRLARRGILFTNHFVTTSICCTSRATILTGMHTYRHRIDEFNQPLPQELWDQSLPAVLRKAGYRTGFVGKWGLGGPLPTQDYDFWAGFSGQGTYFEDVKGEKIHRTRLIAADASRFLENHPAERPFFLHVAFKAPHCLDGDPKPFHPDPAFSDLYRHDHIPPPRTATEAHFKQLPEFLQESEGRVRWRIRFSTPKLFQDSVKDYYRLITGVDAAVGEILDEIEKKGLRENTLVVFTSDNGFLLGEHGLAGKWLMYEESIRVPLLISDPKLPAGRRGKTISEMTLHEDLVPTILDYAGVRTPPRVQGNSLLPLAEGDSPPWRASWFYAHLFKHDRIPRNEGVRTRRWKYIRYLDTEPVYEQLFDLKNDPYEEQNLAPDSSRKEVLGELRAQWEQMRKAAV